jgi:hypothetical protein
MTPTQSVYDRRRIGKPAQKKLTYHAYHALLFGTGNHSLRPVSCQIRGLIALITLFEHFYLGNWEPRNSRADITASVQNTEFSFFNQSET